MALNIGGFIDRKNYGKSTRTENNSSTSKTAEVKGEKQYTIGDLKPGHEFRATVSDVNNNTVKLRLSDGQQISARLDAQGDFNIGDEITFTVKSNDGFQVDITPSRIPTDVNPTLLKALGAADLPATPTNLEMVNSMMNEQLPIDKSSLMSMHRQILNHPDTPIQNLVQMTKFNIPITPENINQFENYKNFENQISKELSKLSNELAAGLDDLAPVKLADMGEEVLGLVKGDGTEAAGLSGQGQPDNGMEALLGKLGIEADAETLTSLKSLQVTGDPSALESALTEIVKGNVPEAVEYNNMLLNIALDINEAETDVAILPAGENPAGADSLAVAEEETLAADNKAGAPVNAAGASPEELAGPKTVPANDTPEAVRNMAAENNTESLRGELPKAGEEVKAEENAKVPDALTSQGGEKITLSSELTPPQRNDLAGALKQIGMPQELVEAVKEGNITDKELLEQIKNKFDSDKGSLSQLADQAILSNKTYQKVLSNAISKQWFLKPGDVAEEQKVSNLYEKLNRQMKQVAEQTANLSGNNSNNIMQLATNTSSNMDFMNHVNQMYAYVQIPVKINGEDKQSDLYVFSNKKNPADKDGEIKALLHLDMDALGSVDAFMKLQDTKLDTKFTLDDDLSYKLFEDHIDELVKRLEDKGYNCTVKFEMGGEPLDFVEDFMKQGQSVGAVQRFAFDVRA